MLHFITVICNLGVDIAVSIVTDHGLDDRSWIPGRFRDFSVRRHVQIVTVNHGQSGQSLKLTTTPYIFIAWCLLKHRDYSTFICNQKLNKKLPLCLKIQIHFKEHKNGNVYDTLRKKRRLYVAQLLKVAT
jgi:hypothetical protein